MLYFLLFDKTHSEQLFEEIKIWNYANIWGFFKDLHFQETMSTELRPETERGQPNTQVVWVCTSNMLTRKTVLCSDKLSVSPDFCLQQLKYFMFPLLKLPLVVKEVLGVTRFISTFCWCVETNYDSVGVFPSNFLTWKKPEWKWWNFEIETEQRELTYMNHVS